MFIILQPYNKHTQFTLLTSYILQMHITDNRVKPSLTFLPILILQIDAKHSFTTLSYRYITNKYIFYKSSAASTGLNTNDTIQIRAIHSAVFYKQVTVTTGNLTADHYSSMSIPHHATTYDNVLTGNIPFTSVFITS